MSIISTAQAVPSRLFTIYSSLYDSSSGELKERLESWATPPSLRTRGGTDEDGEAATSLFTNTLVEARKLGLVEEVGDKLRIPDAARSAAKKVADSKVPFREHLVRILFDVEKAEEAQQSAFLLALSWFLTLNPLSPLGFAQPPQNQMREELGEEYKRTEITSLHRYQNFLYWARFLGFATIVGGRDADDGKDSRWAFPDPIVAVSSALPIVFSKDKEIPIETFLNRLSDIYPVFEGGTSRQELETMLRSPPPPDNRRISSATSLALQRLHDRRSLKLISIADAPVMIMHLGKQERRVSHIAKMDSL